MIFRKENLTLPKQLTVCPIVDASCELRFASLLPDDAVFGASFAKLSDLVGKAEALPILAIPPEIRGTDPNLRFQPHYKFQKDGFTVQLGPRVFAIGVNEPYPGWYKFSAGIKIRMEALKDSGVIGSVSRFGLRYINYVEGDVFDKVDFDLKVNGNKMVGKEMSVSLIVEGRYSHMVRVRKDVNVRVNASNPRKFGSVIDIDTFVKEPIEGLGSFDRFLEEAHHDEKSVFFGMLKPEYLATLKPTY